MRKQLALALVGAMTAGLLAGCGSTDSGSPAAASQDTAAATSAATAAAAASTDAAAAASTSASGDLTDANGAPTTQAAIDAIQKRKDSGNYPKIVLAFMNFAGSPAGIERISQDISKRTEETLGVDVELQIMDAASYSQNMNLMLASGEQVDVFNAVSVGYLPCVNKGYCLDMDEDDLLNTYGLGIKAAVGDKWINASRVSGSLYGITSMKEMGQGLFGISVAQQYLDGIGYDYASAEKDENGIIHVTLDDVSKIFSDLHTKYPDKTVFYLDAGTMIGQCLEVDQLGNDPFGVLTDPVNDLTVSDLFSSDVYKNACKQMYTWNQAGYLSQDAMTETTATTVQVKSGSLMAYKTAIKPGIVAQESNLCGEPMVLFQTGGNFVASNTASSMPWCINSQTEDPVTAMQVLNAFYSDPVLSNLICWGEEGKEYQKTDDGHIDFADGVSADTSEYYNNVNWEMPNQFIADIWTGNDMDVWTKTASFNEQCDTTKALGFTFDSSDVSAEYTALNNVYTEYRDQLELGFLNPDTGIPEMEGKLKAAGLDDYMKAKQSALDEWAKTAK